MRTGAVVGIVVLNWNGREDTLRCLRSLEQLTYPDLVVVVVDNGSTDGSVEAIRASHPNVDVLPLGRNTGFTAGTDHDQALEVSIAHRIPCVRQAEVARIEAGRLRAWS